MMRTSECIIELKNTLSFNNVFYLINMNIDIQN